MVMIDQYSHFWKRSNAVSIRLVWVSIACLLFTPISAYSPVVNHRAIAGIWKLKQTSIASSIQYPLKEFTVYPKPRQLEKKNDKEVLLMLKEDGSFKQYSDQGQKIPAKLRFFSNDQGDEKDDEILDRYCEFGKLKGKWNLVGGKLILAPDRPIGDDGKSYSTNKNNGKITDAILEGEVVATTEEGLLDNPALDAHNVDFGTDQKRSTSQHSRQQLKTGDAIDSRNNAKQSRGGNTRKNSVLDTHLSVPKGQVNIGRFTYPQHHPSFFDSPMFNPRAGGKFELKQVLGTLNTQQQKENEEFEEKFSTSDFYNKTFLLTSHPIPKFRPKGNTRWSIKHNKFVEDPSAKSKKQKEEEERNMKKPTHIVRVLEVKFFANNTFATIGGMGDSAILRGKFSVIGQEKDHIWMQVIRFGFGRSVSGSVFSEGRSLTKDDEKAYWGKIEYDDDRQSRDDKKSGYSPSISQPKIDTAESKKEIDRKLIVKGSVLFGYGLEPLPVGRFVLTETNSIDDDLEDDLDDDDDDDDDDEDDDTSFSNSRFSFDPDDVFQ